VTGPLPERRSDYDVTNTVCVSSPAAVRDAVAALFRGAFPHAAFDVPWIAFHDYERLFDGQLPGYLGCDTVYHDRQHTLDMALAMARLLAGYELNTDEADRLGEDRAVLGLVCALFHDAGYIRRTDEPRWRNGAQFTNWHVSRSADFLREYLPQVGLEDRAELAAQLVHFTGYELNVDEIELDDPRDAIVGHLLGTADLLAQMADRCYLEKCRDRLYAEFVLGGVAFGGSRPDAPRYESGLDLLRQTPVFWRQAAFQRMNRQFNRAYRYMETLFDGRNPYMECIDANLAYLDQVLVSGNWESLRRRPPCFTVSADTLAEVGGLVSRRLAEHELPNGAFQR
jgi:hypothetical protein